MYGAGDAVIGINPASDDVQALIRLWHALDEVRSRFDIPTQTCVLTHVTSQIAAIERGAPVDLVFQSIAGTEKANASFGVTLAMLGEARDAALSLKRATVGDAATATSCTSRPGRAARCRPNAHHGVDQQTCEARAYAVARAYRAAAGRIRWSASSARNTCTTASRSSAPGSRTTSAASCSACRSAATSATPTTPRPTPTTWTRC